MSTSKGRTCVLLAGVFLLVTTPRPAAAGHYTWTTSGPEPGHVFQIAPSPEDPNVALTSVGFWGPMLYRSVNRGGSWIQQDSLFFSGKLVAHPTDSRILYTTGWDDGYGVLKSSNGGQTWQLSSAGLPTDSNSYAIALAPSSPQVLYAVQSGNPAKVFRSGDAAASWTLAASDLPVIYGAELAVDPSDPAVVYMAAYDGVSRSDDSGATWNPTGALPSPTVLRIVASSPATVYAGTSEAGVYKSVDGGGHWNPANAGIADHAVRDLAIDPLDPQKLFAATDAPAGSTGGLFVSTNAGLSWTPVDFGKPQTAATAVAISPVDPSIVFAAAGYGGLRGGLFRSEDGGQTWAPASSGLSGWYSNGVAADPATPGAAYCVSIANVYRSATGGEDWALQGAPTRAFTAFIADPHHDGTLYGGFSSWPDQGGVMKSEDGGATWQGASASLTVSQVWRLAATSEADRILAATGDGLFATPDAGDSWPFLVGGDVRSAAADPKDGSILYAGLANVDPNGYGVLRSDDGGLSWAPPGGIAAGYLHVNDIRTPPSEPDSVYVAASSGVFRSLDRGLTFSPANVGLGPMPGIAPFRLAADPSSGGTLYLLVGLGGSAATEPSAPSAANLSSVFRTVDGAASWSPLPGFLPPFGPLDLSVDAAGRVLYASTANGVFEFERSFLDVPDGDIFWTSVDAAAMNRLTAGCGGGSFCPRAVTSRASVAVFLLRGKYGAAYEPPAAAGDVFSDLPASSLAAAFIEELFHEGITAGCESDAYCPSAPVSRAQLAVLLLKAKHGPDYSPPPATGGVFSDVPADAFAAAWIEQLFAEGIAAGCGGGRYCPDDATSRAQAAALVVRAFGLS